MPREQRTPAGKQYVTHKIQSARRRDLGIENPHRAGGGIAWAGEKLAPLLSLLAIEVLKGLNRHKDLAANLKIGRQTYSFALGQIHAQRNRADGAHVRSNIFPGGAVATSNAGNEYPA